MGENQNLYVCITILILLAISIILVYENKEPQNCVSSNYDILKEILISNVTTYDECIYKCEDFKFNRKFTDNCLDICKPIKYGDE